MNDIRRRLSTLVAATIVAIGVALPATNLIPGTGVAMAQVDISHLGTYAAGLVGSGASEIAAYDPATRRVFAVNGAQVRIDAIDISDPASPSLAFSIDISPYGAGANSVAARNGLIAAAVENVNKQANGRVVFFDTDGQHIADYEAGALPDMICFSPDGSKVLVANEGEPNGSYTVDPEGSVTILDLAGGPENATVTQVGFTAFNGAALDASIRIYGPNATVAQDLEPEYIAVAPDGLTAWVTLQENNALAILDLTTNTVTELVGLGFKDHSLAANGLDASDQSGAIDIRSWPVNGMYEPDGISAFTAGGATYLALANEGDARAYAGLNEERRVNQLNLEDTVFPDETTLKQNTNLGRLRVTGSTGDFDHDGDFDALYAFGARSFTLRDATGAMVWDSGDELEQITAVAYPTNFNSNNDANNSFKTRSDDKGPEPESVITENLYGRIYAFVGLERIGGVTIWDVTDPQAPQFIVYRNHRNFDGNPGDGTALDLGPEGLLYIPAADSPNGFDLLVTANELSGTTSIFRIDAPAASVGEAAAGNGQAETLTNLHAIACRPNPARAVDVTFSLDRSSHVRVTLHDQAGRRIANLIDGVREAGDHHARFDGREASGRPLPAGVYFMRIQAGRDLAVRKLVLE